MMPTSRPQNSTSFSTGMRFVSSCSVTVTEVAGRPALQPDTEQEEDGSFNEGFQAGVAQTQTQAQEIIEDQQAQIEALQQQIHELQNEFPQSLHEFLVGLEQQARREATELAFVAAGIITHREIERESIIVSALDEALGRLTHLNDVKLMVSPEDYILLQGEPQTVPPGIELIQDAQLARGEVFLESPHGFLDGKIEIRLNELRLNFVKLLNRVQSTND